MTGIPRLVFRLMMDGRVPLMLKLILPATLVYVISPFDIVPDFLPALGRIDDLLAVILGLVLFVALAPRDVVSEHIRSGRRGDDEDQSGDKDRRSQDQVIDGSYRFLDDDKKPRR
jgi:uncharacterized membrane protein YkvA (DUF1232 family)